MAQGQRRSAHRCLAVAASIALGLSGCSATGQASGAAGTRYVSGDGTVTRLDVARRGPAPEVSGTTLEGDQFSLSEHRGQVVVVNVWGSWCPPCRAEAPALERVWKATRSHGVTFVGIDVRETSTDAPRAFQRRFAVTYPSIPDPDSSLLLGFRDTLPANAIPSTIVVDRQGRVAARILGGVTEPKLREILDGVAAEALT